MSWKGPTELFAAWVIYDILDAFAFPASCDRLVDRTGVEQLLITPQQSLIAVGLMGILVAVACGRGVRSASKSAIYRAVVAGLEAHVVTHLGASGAQRGYTAGVATALPVMLPGALMARRELQRDGCELRFRDTVNGVALLLPAALVCQGVARLIRRVSAAQS
ncbi:HXXEE domain-containing protein [Brevibacterium linens]|uniref:HXXEE domain-containing protein n=1 Tax=Brevibacterium linens TaxID=1703 RepID=UPI0011AECF02|nr:HXXEE domain-containing protein [Brevibacterium linens]